MSLYLNAVVHNPKNMSATEIAEKVESVLEEFISSRDLKWAPVVELKSGISYVVQTEAGDMTGFVSINGFRVVFLMAGAAAADDAWTAESDAIELMERAFPNSAEV
ncbi:MULTISPECIES: hypothetical protein [unclassified Pseudomonas]|uniref:hypothetical protein n=1 Tax=unclassified Pseudomonas TaxID=196821 RepID=UPI00385C7AAD